MRFRDFVWDYDGTLFDTYDAVCRAYHRAAVQLGIKIPFDELRLLIKHSLGWSAEQLEKRFGVPAKQILDAYYLLAPEEETLEAMKPYPGVKETLKAIAENGGRSFLYSHRDHVSMDALKHYGLDGFFTGAITKDDHFPRKPAPDALLYLIGKYGLDPKTSVMVGDRSLDVEAGLNAGMSGALFDPENFCQGDAPTKDQFSSMEALKRALVD